MKTQPSVIQILENQNPICITISYSSPFTSLIIFCRNPFDQEFFCASLGFGLP